MDCFRGMYYVRRPSIKGTSGQSCIFLTRRGAPEGRRTRGGRIPKRSGPIWSNCAAKTAQNVKMYPTSIRQVLYCTPSGNKCFTARDNNVYIPLVAF
jgi:hypothetical protein